MSNDPTPLQPELREAFERHMSECGQSVGQRAAAETSGGEGGKG